MAEKTTDPLAEPSDCIARLVGEDLDEIVSSKVLGASLSVVEDWIPISVKVKSQ
jgi:hypothetical protein